MSEKGMGNLGQHILKNIATLGPAGYAPVAPGTWGTLVAAVFYYSLQPSLPFQILIVISSAVIGTVAAHQTEKMLNQKDSSHIVIDEFAGYAVSVLMLPESLFYLFSAFLLFRFFDILKPPPIRWMERHIPGGAGIVADDLMAGVYTNLALQIWMRLT